MSSLAQIFCCFAAGFVSGAIGLMLAAIFVPLIVQESLAPPNPAETTGVIIMVGITALFVLIGFALCWKVTGRWVR